MKYLELPFWYFLPLPLFSDPRKSNFHWGKRETPISIEQICCHCLRCSWNIMQKGEKNINNLRLESWSESDREAMFLLCATLCRHTIFCTHLSESTRHAVSRKPIKYKMISSGQHSSSAMLVFALHQFLLNIAADCRTLIRSRWRTRGEKNFNEWMQTLCPDEEDLKDENAPRTCCFTFLSRALQYREIIKSVYQPRRSLIDVSAMKFMYLYIAVIQLCVHAVLIMREIVPARSPSLARSPTYLFHRCVSCVAFCLLSHNSRLSYYRYLRFSNK